jgi:hypothetical protein
MIQMLEKKDACHSEFYRPDAGKIVPKMASIDFMVVCDKILTNRRWKS